MGSTFPTEGILPKTETGAAQFLGENPAWDGRGVIVAVLDSGVDPGAAGLLTTSDGLPKIVDIVDCSSSGDVEMTETRDFPDGMTSVIGLSGRTLALGEWKCPTKKMHLGLKRAYEFFPAALVKRIKEERLNTFIEQQRQAEVIAQRKLGEVEAAPKSGTQKKEKKDAEAVLSALKEKMEQYADAGPVYDCIVFHDGTKWRAVIDSDCSGDMRKAPLLTNYRDERQWSTFNGAPGTKASSLLLNFSVNVYEDGRRLSIVVCASSHGTHVAGILAANFPGKSELNGVAPGAQIVSCKVADSRLGTMETGTSLIRGLIVAKENGSDLINLSYGESYNYPNMGRVTELAAEFVNNHKIIFVSSAGNQGPAISTVGAPGGTVSSIIGVGAYVSPGMMEVQYSLEPMARGTHYTWSSRGPTIDGHMGVCISAPGGAVAPVPTWSLQGKQLMNGTSMSAPNCCGGIALLLSALKSEKIAYSPQSVRRAIENTAIQVEGIDPLTIGHGLLQIPQAFGHLRQFKECVANHIPLRATLANKARGIYLRNSHESDRVSSFQVSIAAEFHPDCDNVERVNFELNLDLIANVPWVKVPKHTLINGCGGVSPGQGFKIVVDPTQLSPGLHFGMVQGFDSGAHERGPLLEFPVTVVRPLYVPTDGDYCFKPLASQKLRAGLDAVSSADSRLQVVGREYSPGTIDRHFIHVPEGATWAQLTFRTHDLEKSHMIVLHTLQLVTGSPVYGRNSRYEHEKYLSLKPHHNVDETFAVRGGLTLEVCVCKWWASQGSCTVDFELEFHGVALGVPSLTITPAGPESLELRTPLRAETLTVAAKATQLRRFYLPTKHVIRALDPARHLLPLGRQVYELELHYAFEQSEKDAVKCHPKVQGHCELLYDSPFEAQLWVVLDANKQVMGSGDALYEYPVTLNKGKYTLRLSLRHDNREALEKLKAQVLTVDFALAKEVSLTVYSTLHAALSSGPKFTGAPSAAGACQVLFVPPPTDRAAGAKAGDVLLGALTVAKAGDGYKEECTLRCLVGKEEEAAEEDAADVARSDAELLTEAVRDAQLGRLKKLREDKKWEAFDHLAGDLTRDHPSHLPLLSEILQRTATEGPDGENAQQKRSRSYAAVAAAENVIRACDEKAMAAHFGVRHDAEDASQKAAGKIMDKRKEALVEAALVKAEALAALLEPAPGRAAADGGGGAVVVVVDGEASAAGAVPSVLSELEDAWELVRRWVTPKEAKHEIQVRYAVLHSAVERRAGRPGAALAELLRVAKSKEGPPSRKVVAELRETARQLGWAHWEAYYADLAHKLFPTTAPLF